MATDLSRSGALELDAADVLSQFRKRFFIPKDTIYLDGNSLGLVSRDAEACVLRVLNEWKQHGVAGWTKASWFDLAERLAAMTAPVVGAHPNEVIVTNSTTVNLHQLVATLFEPGKRDKIVIDEQPFPTDAYALQSQLRLHGYDPATHLLRTLKIQEALVRPDVAMAVLPGVVYTTGELLDMESITREARQRGVLIGWDLSHAIGVVPIELDAWGADFAFWCSYKYLNAGPGAAGGLYLNQRHFDRLPGLAGWFGSDKSRQFDMSFEPTFTAGAGRLQIGTPNILSMAPLEGSLALIHEARMDRIRAKSLRLTRYLIELADVYLTQLGFSIGTPRDDARRGGHVALVHTQAPQICQALKARHIVPDLRPPNVVRLAPVALYTRFVDCFDAVSALEQIVTTREHESFQNEREIVS